MYQKKLLIDDNGKNLIPNIVKVVFLTISVVVLARFSRLIKIKTSNLNDSCGTNYLIPYKIQSL